MPCQMFCLSFSKSRARMQLALVHFLLADRGTAVPLLSGKQGKAVWISNMLGRPEPMPLDKM